MDEAGRSLQEQWFPDGTCFGCGPANPYGLGLRTLLDWHTGAALGWALSKRGTTAGARPVPNPFAADPWATATYAVTLHRPTPIAGPVTLKARVVRLEEAEAELHATLEAGGKACASCVAIWKRRQRSPR